MKATKILLRKLINEEIDQLGEQQMVRADIMNTVNLLYDAMAGLGTKNAQLTKALKAMHAGGLKFARLVKQTFDKDPRVVNENDGDLINWLKDDLSAGAQTKAVYLVRAAVGDPDLVDPCLKPLRPGALPAGGYGTLERCRKYYPPINGKSAKGEVGADVSPEKLAKAKAQVAAADEKCPEGHDPRCKPDVLVVQRALKNKFGKKARLGRGGPKDDGVDGVMGKRTKRAMKAACPECKTTQEVVDKVFPEGKAIAATAGP